MPMAVSNEIVEWRMYQGAPLIRADFKLMLNTSLSALLMGATPMAQVMYNATWGAAPGYKYPSPSG